MKELKPLRIFLASDGDDPKKQGRPSGSAFNPETRTLIIAPLEDEKNFTATGIKTDSSPATVMETILAHELGHFIASLLKDPSHSPIIIPLLGRFPGEKVAWNIANKTGVNIDKQLETRVLAVGEIQQIMREIGPEEVLRAIKERKVNEEVSSKA